MREIRVPNAAFQRIGRGINAREDVVSAGYSDYGPCCNFLYSGGRVSLLNDLLERGSGWNIYQALDINDSGQIAAYACGSPGCTIVRLDPVPEPATYAMLLGGLATLLWAGRRRNMGRVARRRVAGLAYRRPHSGPGHGRCAGSLYHHTLSAWRCRRPRNRDEPARPYAGDPAQVWRAMD